MKGINRQFFKYPYCLKPCSVTTQDKRREVYKVEEYFWQGKRIGSKTTNVFPSIKDKSFIPKSLFKGGMTYFDLYESDSSSPRR